MLSLRGLLDVLFILLLSTIVMLAHAAPIGAVETDLVRIGSGGLSPLRIEDTRFLLVRADGLLIDGEEVTSREDVLDRLDSGNVVMLLAADRDVRHHDIMELWSDLRARGLRVQLGAAPDDEETP